MALSNQLAIRAIRREVAGVRAEISTAKTWVVRLVIAVLTGSATVAVTVVGAAVTVGSERARVAVVADHRQLLRTDDGVDREVVGEESALDHEAMRSGHFDRLDARSTTSASSPTCSRSSRPMAS